MTSAAINCQVGTRNMSACKGRANVAPDQASNSESLRAVHMASQFHAYPKNAIEKSRQVHSLSHRRICAVPYDPSKLMEVTVVALQVQLLALILTSTFSGSNA